MSTQAGTFSGLMLDPSVIIASVEKNLRSPGWDKDKKVQELAEDITENGQISPVLVTDNGDGTYNLVAGFRRHKAIQHANENLVSTPLTVMAMVVEPESDQDALTKNLAENIERENLSPMDMSFAAVKLKESGMSTKEVAKKFHKAEAWVRVVIGFATLPDKVQKLLHSGELNFSDARKLIGLTPEQQDKVLAAIEAAKAAGESAGDAAGEARKKFKKKQAGGRKGKAETKADKKGMSAKVAVLGMEELVTAMKEVEKPTKAQETSVEVFKLVKKLLVGGVGLQTFGKNVTELL